jgi:hypothetical protein
MDALIRAHPLFAAFVLLYVGVCCSVDLMQLGFARRGLLTSNPSEQLHSAWIREREQPIMDFCVATLGSLDVPLLLSGFCLFVLTLSL